MRLSLKINDEDISKEHKDAFKMSYKSIQEIVKETYIELAKDEGRELEREELLSKIVRNMHDLGNSISEIAKNLVISESQVSKYL
jgi:predicted transposase YdaD